MPRQPLDSLAALLTLCFTNRRVESREQDVLELSAKRRGLLKYRVTAMNLGGSAASLATDHPQDG